MAWFWPGACRHNLFHVDKAVFDPLFTDAAFCDVKVPVSGGGRRRGQRPAAGEWVTDLSEAPGLRADSLGLMPWINDERVEKILAVRKDPDDRRADELSVRQDLEDGSNILTGHLFLKEFAGVVAVWTTLLFPEESFGILVEGDRHDCGEGRNVTLFESSEGTRGRHSERLDLS